MNISEFKAQNPDYKDVPDLELADALHAKFYSETPRAEFLKSVGLVGEQSNRFTQAEPRAQYQAEFLAMNPQANQDALDMAMGQYDTAQQKRGAAATDGVAERFRQMQSPEATFNARLDKKLQGARRGVVPPLPGKMQADNPVVKAPLPEPSTLETVGSGIIGGAMSTLAGAGAAGASLVGADETAQELDATRSAIEGRMHELGGESIVGRASALVGGVGTALSVPPEMVQQLVANAGLFAIPAFRDTLKAKMAAGYSEPLALAHAAEAFGINLFMPMVAARGMGAVAGKLGTDGLMGLKGAAAGVGQAAAEGVGFSALNSVAHKGTDLIAGQENKDGWIDPKDMASMALGFGALRAGHRIAGGEPVHNQIAAEIENAGISHRGVAAEALRALDPNRGAAIDPLDTVKPFVPPTAPAAPPAADDAQRVTSEMEAIRPLDKARADLEAAKHESVLTAVAKSPELSAKAVMDAPDLDSALAAAQAIIDAPLPGLDIKESAHGVRGNSDAGVTGDGRGSGNRDAVPEGTAVGDRLVPSGDNGRRESDVGGIDRADAQQRATGDAGTSAATDAKPALTALLGGATRPTRWGAAADPIAQDILKSRSLPDLERALAAEGVQPDSVLGAGASSIVLGAGDKAVRIGMGDLVEIPKIEGMIQPIASGMAGHLRYEIMPKADTRGITESDVAAVSDVLKKQGYVFSDAGTDNVGRINGRLMVIDPGAVHKASKLTAPTQFKGGAHAEDNVHSDKLGPPAAAVDGTAAARSGERGPAAAATPADPAADRGNRATGDVQEAPPPVAGWQEKVAAKEARLQEQLRVANENAKVRAKAKQESADVGLAGEKAPGAKESLELTLRNHPDILRENGKFTPPAWSELPNGFAYRQYVTGGVPMQEVRAPVTSGERPAILRRGMQKDGQTFGEREATGTLGDVMSGASFADFDHYFSGQPQPKTALALKKPQSQGERMRAKLHESDPFLGFLAKNGVSLQDKADTGAERGNRGNRMVPGYGPVFRKNGLRLDELALRAAEEGYLTQADIDSAIDTGGTGKLADMIRRAVADKEVVKDTATPELSPHDIELMEEARRLGVDTDGLSPDQVYDAVKAHHDAAEHAAEQQVGLVSEAELWSEYERMQDAYHQETADAAGQGTRPVAAGGGDHDLAQGNAAARELAAESAEFALSGETVAEGRTRVAEQERQAADAKAKQVDADKRAQADSERGSFTLTGSGRAADVGAAHGQGDLLAEKSSAKDAAEQSTVIPSGNAKVAEKAAPEHDDGADIPHAFMKKTKVPHDVWVVDEGQYETVDIPAHTALKSVREDIANLSALLNCMRGI